MFSRFVAALNTISSQYIALTVLFIGCVMTIVCHKFGIQDTIGAGIVGAGINMLTHDIKSSTTNNNSPTTITASPTTTTEIAK